MCYEIVYTNNKNHTIVKDTKYCIDNGYKLTAEMYENSDARPAKIKKDYIFNWDIFNNDKCFMKLKVQ